MMKPTWAERRLDRLSAREDALSIGPAGDRSTARRSSINIRRSHSPES